MFIASSTKCFHLKSKQQKDVLYNLRVTWPEIGKHHRRVTTLKNCVIERQRQVKKLMENQVKLQEEVDGLKETNMDDFMDRSMTVQGSRFDVAYGLKANQVQNFANIRQGGQVKFGDSWNDWKFKEKERSEKSDNMDGESDGAN